MHGITYIWQSQAPVSINSCLTIEGLSKKCIREEVPCGFFLRTVIVNRGNSCELKPRIKKTFLSCVSFRKFRNVQTQSDILKFLLLLTNVDCWNCLAMVNVIIFLFPLFVFLKQLIAWLKLNPAICYLASLKAYTSKISSWKIFFQTQKMAKSLWDRLPCLYKQFLKTRKSGMFQMPVLFVNKNDFA